MLLSEFQDNENVETPKYHKSTYRSMRKSMEPGLACDVEKKCEQNKQHLL